MTTLDPTTVSPAIELAMQNAFRSIAPTWPLDRWIAVNPFWNLRDRDCGDVAALLATASGARLTMPRAFYRQHWLTGRLQRCHLEAAIAAACGDTTEHTVDADQLELCLARAETTPQPLPLLSDVSDRRRRSNEPLPWSRTVVDQVSQHLADHFDRGQATWRAGAQLTLYTSWRERVAVDRSLPLRGGIERFAERVRSLPAEPREVVALLARRVAIDGEILEDYLIALLASVRGWASWAAFESWQAGLDGRSFPAGAEPLEQLLAIRCAWELLLLDEHDLDAELPEWRMLLSQLPAERAELRRQQQLDWLLQHALDLAYQERLVAGVRHNATANEEGRATDVQVQAVFCIDVRSERVRRHLEAVGGDAVTTHGFAGFFGLPIAHAELDAAGHSTARLPGLLAPTIRTGERATHAGIPSRSRRLAAGAAWSGFRSAPTAAFSFVESLGAAFLPRLLGKSLFGDTPARRDARGLTDDERMAVRPTWPTEGAGSSPGERVDLAAGVLRAMGLDRGLARLVLLSGHGSSSANNAHAAGLECGACGGHAGETNARLLAILLNDTAVREGLRARGIEIPAATWFVAGLHDTTTDEFELFDVEEIPAAHAAELRRLRAWLAAAGERTRAERAPSLRLEELRDRPGHLLRALRRRGRDWAQTRPEWGLADNAAIVVGPRRLTRGLDLGGRVFLHDYDWRQDAERALLTQLLTAPVIVANWINLQYYASTVEPDQFGSGNKLLHNVVGGDLGVFEGNRGDLRIGLARQSVHDGERLRHTPQRLSVVLAAPRDAIEAVLEANEAPRSLVDNRWLHLLRVADDGTVELRLPRGGWRRFEELLPPRPEARHDAAPVARDPGASLPARPSAGLPAPEEVARAPSHRRAGVAVDAAPTIALRDDADGWQALFAFVAVAAAIALRSFCL